jgi:hypothetical protein
VSQRLSVAEMLCSISPSDNLELVAVPYWRLLSVSRSGCRSVEAEPHAYKGFIVPSSEVQTELPVWHQATGPETLDPESLKPLVIQALVLMWL